MRGGDLSARLTWRSGALGDVAEVVNGLAGQQERFNRDLTRLHKRVGLEGRTDERMPLSGEAPLSSRAGQVINELVDALLQPGAEITR